MLSLLWITAIGWVSGAVVNYLADVLPRKRRLTKPVCRHCGEDQPWIYALTPVRCGSCQRWPSLRSWIVFIASWAVAVLMCYFPPSQLSYYGGVLWGVYFGLVAVIDIEHRLILHPVSILGALMAFVHGLYLHGIQSTLLGGGFGFLVMLAFYYLGILFIRGLNRVREGETDEVALGFGDVNLAGVMGLLLGWPGITAGLVIAIFIGGVISALYLGLRVITRQYTSFEALPYGPFLVLSAIYLLYIA